MNITFSHTYDDSKTYEVYEDGTVMRGKTKFKVTRHLYRDADGTVLSNDTHLEGRRGGQYLLRKYLGDDNGRRQMVSLNSGAEYRVRGNAIKVIEVNGIIEFLN